MQRNELPKLLSVINIKNLLEIKYAEAIKILKIKGYQ